jgi:hypothetical protein
VFGLTFNGLWLLLVSHQLSSADVALLVQFLDVYMEAKKAICVQSVIELLLACLTEGVVKTKGKSMLSLFMVWLYQTDAAFTNPDRFQHVCVYIKYALKCAAYKHMKEFKTTDQDQKFVEAHFKYGCASVQLMTNPFLGHTYSYLKHTFTIFAGKPIVRFRSSSTSKDWLEGAPYARN